MVKVLMFRVGWLWVMNFCQAPGFVIHTLQTV